MRINTNVAANNAYRNLSNTNQAVERSIARLSSGFRINRSADDAAGLAIANKLRNTGRALQQAQRNSSQAAAMLQTADGGVQTIASILDRMKELAAQAASDNVGDQRARLDDEYKALNSEIKRIIDTTEYQGTNLLDGSAGGATTTLALGSSTTINSRGNEVASVTIGATTSTGDYTINVVRASGDEVGVIELMSGTAVIARAVAVMSGAQTLRFTGTVSATTVDITITTTAAFQLGSSTGTNYLDAAVIDVSGSSTGSGSGLTILVGATGNPSGVDRISLNLAGLNSITVNSNGLNTLGGAQTEMAAVDTLLDTVNSFIGDLGALQSRIDFASQNTAITLQNTQAAESTIRDADMAQEMTSFTRNQILAQAGTAMLAQANQSSQNVLSLLRG
ncbi:MAG: flagellin [Gemmatimonadales bacterium]|nr:flagellin [Gemmatimonadales bacterium]